MSAQDAAWMAGGADNSIWGILAHLNFYNERYLKRLKGEPVEKSDLENSKTFSGAENAADEDWQAEIERFDRMMKEWQSEIESADESKFSQQVSKENQTTWAKVVGLINTHNAHHGGQIIILRNLQGSWEASKGVS